MNSSVGSDIFVVLSLVLIGLAVLLLLRYYLPLRTTPAYLTVPVFLALVLPLSIFVLVPIDLASSSGTRGSDKTSRGIWLPNGVTLVTWRLMYWLTFALTWFILPLLGEYVDSGYRTPRDRILYSIRSNARYQLVMLICAGAAAIYIFLINGFQDGSAKSLVIALAYCWGLVMAIYLMGHGLVTIPQRLFRNSNPTRRLRRLQGQAVKVHDKLTDANFALEELEIQLMQLRRRKNAVSRDHEDWIEELSDASSMPDARLPTTSRASAPVLPAVITDRYLAEFSRKLMRARHKRLRFLDTWDRLLQASVHAQDVVDASFSKKLVFEDFHHATSSTTNIRFLTPYLRYLLYLKLGPPLYILGGGASAIASVCIVWSEFIKRLAPRLSVIGLTVLSHRNQGLEVAFGGQVIAATWLLYMSIAALASFDDVTIWGNRALVKRNTYGESATWYSGQIAKLTVPLAFNFITFLPPKVYERTQFFKFLGTLIKLTPLGTYFDYFFPMFILVPVLAALFNLYGRIKRIFGFDVLSEEGEESSSESGYGGWSEGRILIERELNGSNHLRLTSRGGVTDGRSSPRPPEAQSPPSVVDPVSQASRSTRPELGREPTYSQRQAQRLAEATAAAEEEDESFFQGFAHRVKNTFDGVERPDWLNDLGKRPKWMGSFASTDGDVGRVGSSRGVGRWFRRPSDGQIRL